MMEVLERMLTMEINDMEKSERDLCKHLTHLALVYAKEGDTVGSSASKKKISKKRPTTIDPASNSDSDSSSATDKDTDGNGPSGESSQTAAAAAAVVSTGLMSGDGAALVALTKAVKVSTDGIQILLPGGLKQTVLQTSEAAIKSWRFVEIGTYTILSELYGRVVASGRRLAAEACDCIVCSKETRGDKQLQSHAAGERAACALREMQKKKDELFEQSGAAGRRAADRVTRVEEKINQVSSEAMFDPQWCRKLLRIAKQWETTAIADHETGNRPGYAGYGTERGTGLAGGHSTENSGLVEALLPEKNECGEAKNKLSEKLRRLEAEHMLDHTEPLFEIVHNDHHMRRHAAVMVQLLELGIAVESMVQLDMERVGSDMERIDIRVVDRQRSPTLTAAERRVFVREERREAYESGLEVDRCTQPLPGPPD